MPAYSVSGLSSEFDRYGVLARQQLTFPISPHTPLGLIRLRRNLRHPQPSRARSEFSSHELSFPASWNQRLAPRFAIIF